MLSKYLFTLRNYRAALVAAFFFGCIAPGAKYLIKNLSPQSMAGILYLFTGLGLLIILIVNRKLIGSLSRIQKMDYKWLASAILSGGILGPAFLTYGIAHISGATASLLLNLEAVLTSLIAWFVFKEHFEKKIVYGMIFIVLGCLILSLNSVSSGVDSFFGFALICCACLFWGVDNNLTRNISHLDPVLTASIKGCIAGMSNLLLGYALGEKLNWEIEVILAGLLDFFGIGVSLIAFIISLSKIGTARTGGIFSTAPLIGAVISIFFLGESISSPMILALLFMVIGFLFHLSENHEHEHLHEQLTHSHVHGHDEHHQHEHGDNGQFLVSDSHTHHHEHTRFIHKHPHFPDIHHQHRHGKK